MEVCNASNDNAETLLEISAPLLILAQHLTEVYLAYTPELIDYLNQNSEEDWCGESYTVMEAELLEPLQSIRESEAAYRNILCLDTTALRAVPFAVALAELRGRLDAIWNAVRQFTTIPNVYESDIDMNGLKALAQHTSMGLIELADAESSE